MKKILVIQTASIGDVILATAILEKLRHYFPESRLDFLVKKGMEPLFEGHPYIGRLLAWDKSSKYGDWYRLLRGVRRERYDCLINLQRFFLTGLLTVSSRAACTIGFDKNPWSRWFSRRVPHQIAPGVHETDRNQALIAELTDANPEKPRLYPQKVKFKGQPANSEPRTANIYYTLSPGSLWFTKQFPEDRWVELIRAMPPQSTVYLLGSGQDDPLCESIAHQALAGKPAGGPQIVNLAGHITLLQAAALMQGARMNFTNDSAPMHLASAVNAPVTVVYCSTSPGFGFGPLSDDSAVVQTGEELSCRPCGLHGGPHCPEKHFRCATAVDMNGLLARL